ncbi:putative sugar phosphate isomerase/epimerase [Streptomyces sp. Tu6071]|nr:putative sugar phosphate isomerase/epimerase [Streptomyces sp. Tu6071]
MDEELSARLSRRGMLGVGAGLGAAALLGLGTGQAAAHGGGHGHGHDHGHGHGHGGGVPALPKGRLGIQLYSLRDKVASLGFAKVFDELERFGYDEVEYAGYTQGTGSLTLPQLARLARDHGLKGIGSHVNYYDDNNPDAYSFAQNLEKVLDDAQTLGLPHIGTASGPFRYGDTVDAWKRAAADFNKYGAAARRRGMKFYHQKLIGSTTVGPGGDWYAYAGQYRRSEHLAGAWRNAHDAGSGPPLRRAATAHGP